MPKYYFLTDGYPYAMLKKDIIETADTYPVEAIEAIPDPNYFWCKHYGEVGEKNDHCGRSCPAYDPKNGKSGCCKHFGKAYTHGKRVMFS